MYKKAGNFDSKHQMTILIYFFNGIIIWIAFRGSLTAVLSDQHEKIPFDNLEGILKTDFFVTTTSKKGATGTMFYNAEPNTLFGDLFTNHMHENLSFIGNEEGLEQLMEKPNKRAHFSYIQSKQI